ncbi:hypothetical protein IHE44_0010567 [Lamprotornis superbus]|uniref:Uncharacterized protein n=1 Tax=Lamprotornis superbus TaxID=245042 RepID=A0A835NF16_9PASS|nr:hypothetical protein IHE44_0010567 [Lamprotornis superbus]
MDKMASLPASEVAPSVAACISCLWMPTTPPAVSCPKTERSQLPPQQTVAWQELAVFPRNLPLANFSCLERINISVSETHLSSGLGKENALKYTFSGLTDYYGVTVCY